MKKRVKVSWYNMIDTKESEKNSEYKTPTDQVIIDLPNESRSRFGKLFGDLNSHFNNNLFTFSVIQTRSMNEMPSYIQFVRAFFFSLSFLVHSKTIIKL